MVHGRIVLVRMQQSVSFHGSEPNINGCCEGIPGWCKTGKDIDRLDMGCWNIIQGTWLYDHKHLWDYRL